MLIITFKMISQERVGLTWTHYNAATFSRSIWTVWQFQFLNVQWWQPQNEYFKKNKFLCQNVKQRRMNEACHIRNPSRSKISLEDYFATVSLKLQKTVCNDRSRKRNQRKRHRKKHISMEIKRQNWNTEENHGTFSNQGHKAKSLLSLGHSQSEWVVG